MITITDEYGRDITTRGYQGIARADGADAQGTPGDRGGRALPSEGMRQATHAGGGRDASGLLPLEGLRDDQGGEATREEGGERETPADSESGVGVYPELTRLGMTAAAYALGMAAMFLIFCEPSETSLHWLRDLILTKIFGVAAGWAAYLLFERTDTINKHKRNDNDENRN